MFAPIDEAIAAIRRGEIVIVCDDADRENEGDFVAAASAAAPDVVNFMVTHGRGLVCMPMSASRLDDLRIPLIVPEGMVPQETAFTVPIDLADPDVIGISAVDRSRCIQQAASADARPEDFRRPGHVFPLRARPGGVLRRPGHTEAAVDLAILAGLPPAGVICEIMNADGTMARVDDLREIANRHSLLMITIADLIAYRRRHERLIERVAEARLPTPFGDFTVIGFESKYDGHHHLALLLGEPDPAQPVLVRMHSECLTGDVFQSLRCDCGVQLELAMRTIAEAGSGVIVYVRGHEGRGIGIIHKLRAYQLQETGYDTVDANVALGFAPDLRDYGTGAQILAELGLRSLRLLTNNPAKRVGLQGYGLHIAERVPLVAEPNPENAAYLRSKRDRMGHVLDNHK